MHLPADFQLARNVPPVGCGPEVAEAYTRWLATHHYENFMVVSFLLPKHLRQNFYNVYAYCRWADDLGDEVADPAQALQLLEEWERELRECYAGRATHPVFIALARTIRECEIPVEPFADLLVAFRQDQVMHRYDNWGELLDYCRYSANPVGRLILYLCGYRDAARQQLSDATCTALQLANFWQDVSRDLLKGRIYIPLDVMAAHGVGENDITEQNFDDRYVALMKDVIERTRKMFAAGAPLADRVNERLRVDIEMFSRGGLAVLDAIAKAGYNTLEHRPSIGKATQARLLVGALALQWLRPDRAATISAAPPGLPMGADRVVNREARSATGSSESELARSYAECRRVAREAASNFYYAFFMLPPAKRDALCALYAFMRLVDDVSDSVGGDSDRQRGLTRWRAALDAAGEVSGHAILPAFAHTMSRFGIPARYLHDLISGAEMDLMVSEYSTFERLREYCYRVAGTVGLTCLHVFEFDDPHAPELAEKLGIAFQLTNIIRDVSSDYQMGRIYLPLEDLERFGVRPGALAKGPLTAQLRDLLAFECSRAWSFYGEGVELIPRIHQDSRAALWALVRIYSGLLRRVEMRGYDVFSQRVRLTTPEKTRILLRARFGWYSQTNVLEQRDRDRGRPGGSVLGRRAS
jgi:squalene synthase HpnC/squalene synthase HpnD